MGWREGGGGIKKTQNMILFLKCKQAHCFIVFIYTNSMLLNIVRPKSVCKQTLAFFDNDYIFIKKYKIKKCINVYTWGVMIFDELAGRKIKTSKGKFFHSFCYFLPKKIIYFFWKNHYFFALCVTINITSEKKNNFLKGGEMIF